MSRIKLDNVCKSYDGKTLAVKNINVDIKDGEFIVLVGPSGCGKTTLLRMIAGLEDITSGDLYIGDERVNDMLPKDRDLAMVFQNYALYPNLTVYDNIAYPLKLRKIDKKTIDETVRKAADIIGISQYLDRKPSQLSGGQKQRVALGRCIVRSPKAFLMDEPLSNLDAKLRVQMRVEISNLQRSLKKTFIYVTHDQIEAMTMGDRIIVMNYGNIQQIGTAEELYDNPVNKFVASFIGSPEMNFLESKDSKLVVNDFSYELDKPGDYYLAFRPESAFLEEPEEESISFDAKIHSLEPIGAENYVHFLVNDEVLIMRDFIKKDIKIGEDAMFYIKKKDFFIFNKDDEERADVKIK